MIATEVTHWRRSRSVALRLAAEAAAEEEGGHGAVVVAQPRGRSSAGCAMKMWNTRGIQDLMARLRAETSLEVAPRRCPGTWVKA